MKHVIAGGDCSTTNCYICPEDQKCAVPNGNPPPSGCTWGICLECCDEIGEN